MKTYYLVMALKKEMSVEVMGTNAKLQMSYADGMIGVIPVFKDLESALKYADDDSDIIKQIEVNEYA